MPASDPEKVFAETLCLVATATARSASAPFADAPDHANAISQSLVDLPLTLHAYVAGSEVLRTGAQSAEGIPDYTPEIGRMLEFYQAHIPDGRLPDRKTLRNAMILWMGRISPRGLDEHPEARVDRLGLVDDLNLHLRLSEAYARNVASGKGS